MAALRRAIVADLDQRVVPAAADRIDEARQLVLEKLLVADGGAPGITSYRGTGALHAWCA